MPELCIAKWVETALGLSSQSRISTMIYAAEPSKPFSFKTNVKLSGAFQASGTSQLSEPNCGNRGEIRLIKTFTDIPAVCIRSCQENWAVGPESSASLCARVATSFSNDSPIPMARVKNMSACLCGKNATSGHMKCWTYYDSRVVGVRSCNDAFEWSDVACPEGYCGQYG